MKADELHSDEDYILPADGRSIWIEVGGISLWIRTDGDSVSVEFYPLHDEMEEPVAQAAYRFEDVTYCDEALEGLWDEFITPIDDDGIMEESFLHFPKGTDREDVWHWFDERHSKGVAWLLNERGYDET